MSQEWMIDVLRDLTDFARRNGLMGLAAQLDETLGIAAAEMKRSQGHTVSQQHGQQDRKLRRTIAAGENP